MRATTIPAQITTVEDKIAGNLNMTQVSLLAVPIIFTAMAYTAFPPTFHFALYKLPLILLVVILCIVLSLRIKGKVVLSWLIVVLRFNLRPRFYVFNKNDEYLRDMYVPEVEKKTFKLFNLKFLRNKKSKEIAIPAKSFDMKDLMKLKDFLHNPNYTLSFKTNSKGGLYVALEQIKH